MYRKILIVKPSSLGDIVHSLPFLNSLRACFPKSEIHWVVAKGLEGLLEGHPMIDRLIVVNKDTWKKISKTGETIKELKRLFRALTGEGYDLAVDLQGLLRSGLITMATRAPVRIGFSEAREGSRLFYTGRVSGGGIHAVDRYMKVAGALGCDTENIVFPFPLFKSDMGEVRDILDTVADYAVMVPGARKPANRWPARRYGELASLLPVKSLVIGSRSDAGLADEVVGLSKGKAVSIAGRTDIRGLIEVVRGARFAVSNDTGPMHIAAALGVPVFALFGPADPARTGPYGKGHIVIKSNLDCAPCFKRHCKDLRCMEGITVETVYEKVLDCLIM